MSQLLTGKITKLGWVVSDTNTGDMVETSLRRLILPDRNTWIRYWRIHDGTIVRTQLWMVLFHLLVSGSISARSLDIVRARSWYSEFRDIDLICNIYNIKRLWPKLIQHSISIHYCLS